MHGPSTVLSCFDTVYILFLCVLAFPKSVGDYVCNQVKPFSTKVYQQIIVYCTVTRSMFVYNLIFSERPLSLGSIYCKGMHCVLVGRNNGRDSYRKTMSNEGVIIEGANGVSS